MHTGAADPSGPDVLVIGAGVAGLTCAAALADRGLRVEVLEARQALGGRATSTTDAVTGDEVDIGPHVLVTDYRNMLSLLERLGTADRIEWQRQPLITLLDDGRRRPLPASSWPAPLHGLPDLPQVVRALGWRDILSNWRVAWRAARLTEAGSLGLDALDALTDLRRLGVSPGFIAWFWRGAALALLNVPLERCSAASLARIFRLMSGRSGFSFGFPRVALESLFAPGCVAAIAAAGGRVTRGAAVRALRLRDGRCVGVELADGRRLEADRVVAAVPPAALAPLWPAHGEEEARRAQAFAAVEPSPYVSTMLWYDRPLRLGTRFWARIPAPGDLNMDFYDLTAIRGRPDDAPTLVAANAIHAHAATALDDAAIVRRTHAEIAQFAPHAGAARVLHARVHRIPMAIPCPAPGFESLRPPVATPFAGLWLAGDWIRTGLPCSMESAARSGLLAAEAVLAAAGRPAKLAQPLPETTGLMGWMRRHWPLTIERP